MKFRLYSLFILLLLNINVAAHDKFEQFLVQNLKNKKVGYYSNTGNAGDAVIWYGSVCLFKNLGISYKVFQGHVAYDVILFGGGGNFVPYYHHCAAFVQMMMFAGAPIIVLPHTIQGHETLLANLLPNVTLCCREEMSYNYCTNIVPYPQNVLLACDLAFYVDFQAFAPLKKAPDFPPKHLYAFRTDAEANPLRKKIPLNNEDISLSCGSITPQTSFYHNFKVAKEFIRKIDAYDVIWTDRLHVGIVGFLLGKQVHLFDNSYGKVRAVYDHTIKPKDHAHQVIFHEDWEIIQYLGD